MIERLTMFSLSPGASALQSLAEHAQRTVDQGIAPYLVVAGLVGIVALSTRLVHRKDYFEERRKLSQPKK